jgi:hypothetical protein
MLSVFQRHVARRTASATTSLAPRSSSLSSLQPLTLAPLVASSSSSILSPSWNSRAIHNRTCMTTLQTSLSHDAARQMSSSVSSSSTTPTPSPTSATAVVAGRGESRAPLPFKVGQTYHGFKVECTLAVY